MPKSVTIYHNPKCSKSRQTLSLLQEHGYAPTVIEYLQTPPDATTLREILARLALTPRELMRKKEAPYADNQLADERLSEADLIQAMIDDPILIERPIVVTEDAAAIGRPPETVLDIL